MTGSPNAIAIELVGNRFLRRMVRVLVSTAVQQVLSGEESMLRVMEAGRDAETGAAAPACGLTLAGVLY